MSLQTNQAAPMGRILLKKTKKSAVTLGWFFIWGKTFVFIGSDNSEPPKDTLLP